MDVLCDSVTRDSVTLLGVDRSTYQRNGTPRAQPRRSLNCRNRKCRFAVPRSLVLLSKLLSFLPFFDFFSFVFFTQSTSRPSQSSSIFFQRVYFYFIHANTLSIHVTCPHRIPPMEVWHCRSLHLPRSNAERLKRCKTPQRPMPLLLRRLLMPQWSPLPTSLSIPCISSTVIKTTRPMLDIANHRIIHSTQAIILPLSRERPCREITLYPTSLLTQFDWLWITGPIAIAWVSLKSN